MDELTEPGAVTRRRLITGAAAAAALGGVAAAATTSGAAGAAFPALGGGSHPEVLGTTVAGLTYLPIDALDFFPDGLYNGGDDPRYVDPITGVGIAFSGGHTAGQLAASLPLPAGSVIRQINVSYYGTPIINVYGKPLATPGTSSQSISQALTAGAGAKTQTFTLDGSTSALQPITVAAATTYTLRFYVGPGDTIHGVTVGYSAPLQGFVPFTGANPRVLDTRTTTKLNPGEDRTVGFSGFASGGARAVLFNLAVTETEGVGGFVGAYSASLAAWPGNASINWFGANQNLSNAVTCALSPAGEIKLHGGANKTHVVVDVVGYLY